MALLVAATVSAWPAVGRADIGSSGSTSAASDSNTGALAVGAALSFSGGRQPTGSAAPKPKCSWEKFSDAPDTAVVLGPLNETNLADLLAQADTADATLYMKTCPTDAGASATWVLVPNRVSVDDLIASASQQVRGQVPSPTMNINPDPAVGGTVNVGLWLALDDPGQVSITAEVGPVWATVTARFTGSSWTFGNGDAATCDGLGTPIVDTETAEQGPCGYTYRWPSAPRFTGTDDLSYHCSVTGHWVVTYATSAGTSGTLAPIDRTLEYRYAVRELQTVRVAGDG